MPRTRTRYWLFCQWYTTTCLRRAKCWRNWTLKRNSRTHCWPTTISSINYSHSSFSTEQSWTSPPEESPSLQLNSTSMAYSQRSASSSPRTKLKGFCRGWRQACSKQSLLSLNRLSWCFDTMAVLKHQNPSPLISPTTYFKSFSILLLFPN